MREIHFYRTASARCPVEEFLESLSGKQAQKVVWVLRLIKELERVPEQYLKKLASTEDLWEIRAQHGGNAFRLLGFFDGAEKMVLVERLCQKVAEDAEARDRARRATQTRLFEQEGIS